MAILKTHASRYRFEQEWSSVWFQKNLGNLQHATSEFSQRASNFEKLWPHLRPNDNLSLVKEQQKERRFELGFETICPNWEKWFRNPTTIAILIYDPTKTKRWQLSSRCGFSHGGSWHLCHSCSPLAWTLKNWNCHDFSKKLESRIEGPAAFLVTCASASNC